MKKKFVTGLVSGLLVEIIFQSQCLAGVDIFISGKYTLPAVGCSENPNDWVFIKFPKAFTNIPTVIVTHEVSALRPEFGDAYFSVSGITKLGFNLQRRSLGNGICNEVATVNYMAMGN